MGYYTSVSGEIAISPPIPWGEIIDSPFLPGEDGWTVGDKAVALRVESEIVETVEGTLTRRSAVAVVPASEDSYKAYSIVEDLQELVDEHGEGRTFTGRLDGEGEDNGDMWRLAVRDGRAVKGVASIVWPDEDGGS